uniref:coronin-2A-like n=1 Tax=Myxine glutinosa TaxID=7769 RepID=UPI00358F0407
MEKATPHIDFWTIMYVFNNHMRVLGAPNPHIVLIDLTRYMKASFIGDHDLFQSDVFQEDLYPKTASSEPALTAEQWLSGVNRSDYSYPSTRVLNTGHCIDPNMKTMMRLKHRDHSLACWTVYLGSGVFSLDYGSSQLQPVVLCPLLVSLMENYKPTVPMELRPRKGQKAIDVERPDEKSPPANEKELRRMVTCQRDEIRQLREQLAHRDLQLQQCELELQNQRNTHKPVSSPGRNDSTYA